MSALTRAGPQDGDATVAEVETLDIQPTLPQAALLVRYIAGRFVLGALVDRWPNLRAEFRRVGLSDDQRDRLEGVRWLAVIPAEQLNDAHQVLVRAAA